VLLESNSEREFQDRPWEQPLNFSDRERCD
jgi:hypothetical protein